MRDVKKLSWQEFIAQYDPSVHDAISANRKKAGVDGVATLQCEVLDSSRCGILTALIYGPGCTYKSVDKMLEIPSGIYTTGLPSSAAFPINFTTDLPA
jgi:hypothetical protein